jgi:dolichol-phosphate mannosyltransferase
VRTTTLERADATTGPAHSRIDCEICVVVPAYNEEENLEALYSEVTGALAPLGVEYRFLFVDDGSTDSTPAILQRLRSGDPRVCYVRLARNFGLQGALTAGLGHAVGRAVIVMDADLQDDPAAIREFFDRWRAGAEVVYAIRTKRHEGWLKRTLSSGFYWLMTTFANIPVPRDAGSFALYDRRVVDTINSLPERNRYLPGLRAWVGFRQVGVPVDRRARHAGPRCSRCGGSSPSRSMASSRSRTRRSDSRRSLASR